MNTTADEPLLKFLDDFRQHAHTHIDHAYEKLDLKGTSYVRVTTKNNCQHWAISMTEFGKSGFVYLICEKPGKDDAYEILVPRDQISEVEFIPESHLVSNPKPKIGFHQ